MIKKFIMGGIFPSILIASTSEFSPSKVSLLKEGVTNGHWCDVETVLQNYSPASQKQLVNTTKSNAKNVGLLLFSTENANNTLANGDVSKAIDYLLNAGMLLRSGATVSPYKNRTVGKIVKPTRKKTGAAQAFNEHRKEFISDLRKALKQKQKEQTTNAVRALFNL